MGDKALSCGGVMTHDSVHDSVAAVPPRRRPLPTPHPQAARRPDPPRTSLRPSCGSSGTSSSTSTRTESRCEWEGAGALASLCPSHGMRWSYCASLTIPHPRRRPACRRSRPRITWRRSWRTCRAPRRRSRTATPCVGRSSRCSPTGTASRWSVGQLPRPLPRRRQYPQSAFRTRLLASFLSH